MIKQLAQRRIAKSREDRYGERYNFGATYFDARDEALRRGDRTIGTEHLLLALLVDPDSPAARAVGRDLDTARRALDLLDSEALAAIGLAPGVAAGPVAPRPRSGCGSLPRPSPCLPGSRIFARTRGRHLASSSTPCWICNLPTRRLCSSVPWAWIPSPPARLSPNWTVGLSRDRLLAPAVREN